MNVPKADLKITNMEVLNKFNLPFQSLILKNTNRKEERKLMNFLESKMKFLENQFELNQKKKKKDSRRDSLHKETDKILDQEKNTHSNKNSNKSNTHLNKNSSNKSNTNSKLNNDIKVISQRITNKVNTPKKVPNFKNSTEREERKSINNVTVKLDNNLDAVLSENNNEEKIKEKEEFNGRKPTKKEQSTKTLGDESEIKDPLFFKILSENQKNFFYIDNPLILNYTNMGGSTSLNFGITLPKTTKTREFKESLYQHNLKNIEKTLSMISLNQKDIRNIDQQKIESGLSSMSSPHLFNSPTKSHIEEILPILNLVENCKEEYEIGKKMTKKINKIIKKNVSKISFQKEEKTFRRNVELEPENQKLVLPGYFLGGTYRKLEDIGKLSKLEIFETANKMKFEQLVNFKNIIADGMKYTSGEKEILGIREKKIPWYIPTKKSFHEGKNYFEKIKKLQDESDQSFNRFGDTYNKISKSNIISNLNLKNNKTNYQNEVKEDIDDDYSEIEEGNTKRLPNLFK